MSAQRITAWAAALCEAGGDRGATLHALGLRDGGSRIERPVPGVQAVELVPTRDLTGVQYVELELADPVGLDELRAALGEGRELPVSPGGQATVEFGVRVAGAPRGCAVLARYGRGDVSAGEVRVRSVALYPERTGRPAQS